MRHPIRRERVTPLLALLCAMAASSSAQDDAGSAGDRPVESPESLEPTEPSAEEAADVALRLTRAEQLLDDGEIEAVLKILRPLEESGVAATDEARLWHALGRALLRKGEYDDAVVYLVRTANELPEDYSVLSELGEALLLQGQQAAWRGDYESAGYALLDARRMYEEAAAQEPTKADPWLGAARAERQRGDPDEAARLLEKALSLEEGHVGSLVELASLRFANIHAAKAAGNEAAAERERGDVAALYHRALLTDDSNAFALNGLAWLALSTDDEAEAIGWFHRSLISNPTLTDSYDNLARLLSKSSAEKKRLVELLDDVVAAAARFGEGDARTHARATALYRRGMAHATARDGKGLDRDLAQAAKLWPPFAEACEFQRVRGLYFDNAYPKAARILLKMARHDFPAVVTTISQQKNVSEAVAMIHGLADKSFRTGDIDAARQLFKITAEVLVDSSDDWNNYAFFARDTGKYEESYAAYERALELDPSNPALLNDTALILHYHLLRDLDRAEELYALAIEEGTRLLADEDADQNSQNAAKIAVRDATNNLALLKQARASGGPKGRGKRDGAASDT